MILKTLYLDWLMEKMVMGKSKEILKCFMIVIYMDIFFLGAELMAAYIESKPIKIILCINISCFSILLILTIIKLVRKDDELSMYSSLLLFGCSISWMMPMLLYGSLFGKNTGIVTGILYAISIGIGIDGDTINENLKLATGALDLALGRGGDQAVIKSGKNIEFFGGNAK